MVLAFALNSHATIFKMVESAPIESRWSSAFLPLFAGPLLAARHDTGCSVAIGCGLSTWIGLELFGHTAVWPPQLVGFLIAAGGMVAGSLLTPRYEASFTPGRGSLSVLILSLCEE